MLKLTSWKVNPLNLLCLAMLSIILVMMLTSSKPTYTPHRCIDPSHTSCDGNCECDGMGCNEAVNKASYSSHLEGITAPMVSASKLRSYQISIEDRSNLLLIWDEDRLVGTIPFTWNTLLGKMVIIDND